MFRNILIPTDGSALSRKAARAGVAFARATGARVTGMHAPERYEVLAYGEYFPPDLVSREEWDKRSRKTAERFLSAIEKLAKAAGVRYAGIVVEAASPWEAIVEAARKRKCDLVFMGSHGRTGLSGLLLGSQAAKVLAHSKIPVLVYK